MISIDRTAIVSLAGVGYYFDLAELKARESVLDLGSGSGMDTFAAVLKFGPGGRMTGVDMADAQRLKAERLRDASGIHNVTYLKRVYRIASVRERTQSSATA